MNLDEVRQLLDVGAAGAVNADFDAVHHRAVRSRRRLQVAAVVGTVLVVAAGIAIPLIVSRSSGGSLRQETPHPSPSPPNSSAVRTDPAQLLGRWTVQATGTPTSTILRIGHGLGIREPCGTMEGAWRADRHGVFIGEIDSGSPDCLSEFSAPWISTAVGYRVDGSTRLLLDRRGSIVALLQPVEGAARPASPPWLDQLLAPSPGGLQPATVADLTLRRWQALIGQVNPRSYLQFDADTAWSGSDGCNGAGGRYAIGQGGELLVVSGGSTDVGCANSPATTWLEHASRIGITGGDLVLFGSHGGVIGRLSQQPSGVISGDFREVGGTAPGLNRGLTGRINVRHRTATGRIVGVVDATAGHFAIAVPPGRYVLVGTSPAVVGARCPSAGSITVRVGATTHGTVLCQLN